MSVDVKAHGTLRFESIDALRALLSVEASVDDLEELSEVVAESSKTDGASLTLQMNAAMTANGNLALQDWLEDLVERAVAGHLDTWQEDFGDEKFVRLLAGGDERVVEGPFPGPRSPL